MKWNKFEIKTLTGDSEKIGEILDGMGINGYQIIDNVPLSLEDEKKMYTDIPAELPIDDGRASLVFYIPADKDDIENYSTGSSIRDEDLEGGIFIEADDFVSDFKLEIEKINKDSLRKISVFDINYELHDDEEWKDKWKESFKPFKLAEDIWISPSWVEDEEEFAGSTLVKINPGMAFGTGTHETTKLCLLSLRKYIHDDLTILDAGCGSGILAILALLLGAKNAFCLDIDPNAVEGTIENARINGIGEGRLRAVEGNILEGKDVDGNDLIDTVGGKYDIVVANILSEVIISLSPLVDKYLKDDGLYITSGILAEKAGEVRKAIEGAGFLIVEENEMGEWVSFVAKKAHS